jgi:hypothetical protein
VDRLTLTQAARTLRVPQHRLIHLCEKNVVVPDVENARGRGSSRGFSLRNLFEFAVAIELRRLDLPVNVVRSVLQAVRSFEEATRRQLPDFRLPTSLTGARALNVSAAIVDGTHLYFSVADKDARKRVVGGVTLPTRRKRSSKPSPAPRKLSDGEARDIFDSARTRMEIDLTKIAHDLPSPMT